MSDFPRTRREMLRMGYKHTGNAECKACHAPIEWWTTKNGKSLPYDPIQSDWDQACPKADEFRGKGAAAPAAALHMEPQVEAVKQQLSDTLMQLAILRGEVLAREKDHDLAMGGGFLIMAIACIVCTLLGVAGWWPAGFGVACLSIFIGSYIAQNRKEKK